MKETDIVIPFTEEDVRKYLDDMIEFWRDIRDNIEFVTEGNEKDKIASECYIDAYQSVRKNLFGELKND